MRPNGLAYDAKRRLVLAANVGDPAVPHSYTLSMIDLDANAMRASIEVPGRTRWAVFDAEAQAFYVNIMHPSQIVVVDARQPDRIARTMPVPADGAHGLDFDPATRRLFCACDAGVLVTLDAGTGKVLNESRLSGVPDVVWFNRQAPAAHCRDRRSRRGRRIRHDVDEEPRLGCHRKGRAHDGAAAVWRRPLRLSSHQPSSRNLPVRPMRRAFLAGAPKATVKIESSFRLDVVSAGQRPPNVRVRPIPVAATRMHPDQIRRRPASPHANRGPAGERARDTAAAVRRSARGMPG